METDPIERAPGANVCQAIVIDKVAFSPLEENSKDGGAGFARPAFSELVA